jgi:dsDNA-binding SOS-regulon protein
MAVIVKYIVVRNGEEKMTFATKKEADAYDKMLDIADEMYDFLDKSKLKLDENLMEDLSLMLAENRVDVIPILKGGPKTKKAKKPEKKEVAPKKSKPKK